MTPGQKKLLDHTIALRGTECEFCGRQAKPMAGFGRRRYAHLCPHGTPCVHGHRLLGVHNNHPDCKQCLANPNTIYSKAIKAKTTS